MRNLSIRLVLHRHKKLPLHYGFHLYGKFYTYILVSERNVYHEEEKIVQEMPVCYHSKSPDGQMVHVHHVSVVRRSGSI